MADLAMGPAQFCQAFFIAMTVTAVGVRAIPTLRGLVSYGPRTVSVPGADIPPNDVKSKNFIILDTFTKLQVPHTWFTHFYMVSVASSAFWAYQLVSSRGVFNHFAPQYTLEGQGVMTMNQIIITWALMAVQGSRRLYESLTLLKTSAAKMPLASYGLGIAFYLAVGVSVWAEGIPTLLYGSPILEQIELAELSAKSVFAISLFLVASSFQHDSHVYLASLRKYTLPERRLFRWILCPHYTCECAIYLALAIAAAPQRQVLNKTLSTALIFTIANLAITAGSTRAWYARKFGEENIKRRSRMIPYVY